MPRYALALVALISLALTACGSLDDLATPTATERSARRPTQPPPATATLPPAVADLLQVSADDPRSLGSADAPVTIIEYSDFE